MCNSTGRRRWRAVALSLAATLAVAVGSAAARPAPRPLLTGVTDPDATAIGSPLVFDRVAATGARFVRLSMMWRFIAPRDKPLLWDPTNPADLNYDWDSLDQEIRSATEAGLTPLLQLYTAPRWAQGCEAGSTPCDPDPAAVAEFAEAAARRYSGHFGDLPRVRFWQPFDEPNLALFFRPQYRGDKPVSPELYRAILERYHAAVKAVDPSNVVVSAALAPLGGTRAAIAPLQFARQLLCMRGRRSPKPTGGCEGGVPLDAFAIDPFTTGGPTHHTADRDDLGIGDLPDLQRLLAAADRADHLANRFRRTPLWIVEFSWDSKPPDPGGLPMRIHARWTSEALYRAWRAGVDHFFWFGLRDHPTEGHRYDQTIQSGLYFRGRTLADDRPKRTLKAFRFPLVAFPREKRVLVWGRTPTSDPGTVRLSARIEGHWRTIGIVHADSAGIFRRFLKNPYGRARRGSIGATFRGEKAVPFSLRNVPDFYQRPFGNPQ